LRYVFVYRLHYLTETYIAVQPVCQAFLLHIVLLTLFSAGFQYLTETYIAVQRIDKFLSMPEPPPPVHMRAKPAAAATAAAAAAAGPAANVLSSSNKATSGRLSVDSIGAAAAAGGSKGTGLLSRVMRRSIDQQGQQKSTAAVAAAADGVVLCDQPDGYIELGGADYDWNTNVEEMAAQVSRLSCQSVQRGGASDIASGCCAVRSNSMQVEGHDM
jgi:hypothetical protein